MSFSGNIEHIPLVDVIQLLHGTKKSGILNIEGNKGSSQLVFKSGYIVSASHLNNSVRIGEFMVERGDVKADALEWALAAQQKAGQDRQPLILTLVSMGLVEEAKAYAALRALISKTIVEMLTWERGDFVLEPLSDFLKDDFRFYPNGLAREINVDVQGALLDALRIYDEKVRDGELKPDEEPEDEIFDEIAAELLGVAWNDDRNEEMKKKIIKELTASDLGLDALDEL
jgi:hypothetical protein